MRIIKIKVIMKSTRDDEVIKGCSIEGEEKRARDTVSRFDPDDYLAKDIEKER